jgi:hypothetical protein
MVSKSKKRQKGGRPPVSDADRREILVRVLVNAAEQEELQGAAASASMPVSTWVRWVALERARAVAAEKEAARDREK